ncbi:hypothetical protein DSO57_1013555 [Entomophthora muscae]|uniref:Uncharacterized protein n=1 Tax=Entomophthora muscae TaxID=34485 RepID=A0ACC2RKI6_9FUNG|nr:hypothetical protein DSO57_1013555 [Entomophthora muscae]
MLPLPKNAFPNLIHFYTNTEQPDSFWPDLINAAPNLLYIHTDTIQAKVLELETLKPLLQIVPYRNILGNTSDKYDFINKYF